MIESLFQGKSNQAWLRLTLLLVCALLSAACQSKPVGGKCQHTDFTEFAQVKSVGSIVILQSSLGHNIELPQEEFKPHAEEGQYYQLNVRRHTSGGCSPFTVLSSEALQKDGFALSPTPGQAYQAAFILDVARNCAHRPAEICESALKLSTGFNNQPHLLENIDPRSVNACTAAAMQQVWPQLQAATDTQRLITCVVDSEKNEVVIEFLRIETDKKHEQLLLNRIY